MPTVDDGEPRTVRFGGEEASGRDAYRLTDRAAAFTRELGYGAGDAVPADLCRALRRVGDARPRDAHPATEDVLETTDASLTTGERTRLESYLANHPMTGDASDDTTARGLPADVADRIAVWADEPSLDPDEREGRIDELTESPGVVASVNGFAAFEPRVRRLVPRDDGLRYAIDRADGVLLTVDDRRFGSTEGADFAIRAGESDALGHVARVADGHLRRWRPYRTEDADETPVGEVDERYLDAETYHQYLVHKSRYVGTVLEFFAEFPDYDLSPVE